MPYPELITALLLPEAWPHRVECPRVVETHISWVILTGPYAYKIKKPVNFGFLDFSTLQQRRHYCHEEVRLNQRLAPRLYLGVVAITASNGQIRAGGDSPAIDYAVKMIQFPPHCLLSDLITAGTLTPTLIDNLALTVAEFHGRAPAVDATSDLGTPEAVHAPVRENFAQLRTRLLDKALQETLTTLADWSEQEFQQLVPALQQRHHAGWVRECHGDLHLANIVALEGNATPFDCIEFSESLRWIDVMSEVAFLVMDLIDHQRTDLAFRFLNGYLEHTGDYEGCQLLPYYLVYRAMVRAKVAALRLAQDTPAPTGIEAVADYLHLADTLSRSHTPAVILMHGLSGSGKTWVSRHLAEQLPAIHIRSDVERKRIIGLDSLGTSHSSVGAGLYRPDITRQTYGYLAELTACLIKSGFTTLVDATFTGRGYRQQFRELASTLAVPLLIVHCVAPVDTLRQRLESRAAYGRDASEADTRVLEHQIRTAEPLTPQEQEHTVVFDHEKPSALNELLQQIRFRLPRTTPPA